MPLEKEHGVSDEHRLIKYLFNNGGDFNDYEKIAKENNLELDLIKDKMSTLKAENRQNIKPHVVVDPRFLGFRYPSYIFIETRNRLNEALETSPDKFKHPDKALMLGTVFGDVDLVHRRVDQNKYRGAEFAKKAKTENKLPFFEDQETSPINEIIRWYGKDVSKDNYLLDEEMEDYQLEARHMEVLKRLIENPTISNETLAEDINDELQRENPDLLFDDEEYDIIKKGIIEEWRKTLRRNTILGYSISFDIDDTYWHQAIIGLSMEPGAASEQKDKEDHELAVEKLRNYSKFHVPFITSGVGQQWGDIMLEVRFTEISDINGFASDLRDIPGVESTRTYLLSKTNFNKPLETSEIHPADYCSECERRIWV